MKKFLAMGLVSLGLLAAGCEGPIPAYQTQNGPLQVSMTDYSIQDKIRVEVPQSQRVANGQLKVTINVFNRTNRDLTVFYKYSFVDKGGAPVDNLNLGWEHEIIAPNGFQPITFTSLSAAADDFRVQLRGSQP